MGAPAVLILPLHASFVHRLLAALEEDAEPGVE